MDKKKLVGIVVFVVLFGLFLAYPKFEDYQEMKRIEAMLQDEMYREVLAQFDKSSYEIDSWQYLAKLRSQYYLGYMEEFEENLYELIKKDQKKQVQVLVDELHENLIEFLMPIEQMGGIKFNNEKARDALAFLYLASWEPASKDIQPLEKALEIRGEIEGADIVDIYYYLATYDIESLTQLSDNIPSYLEETYYHITCNYILGGLGGLGFSDSNEFDLVKHIDRVNKADLPDSVKRAVGYNLVFSGDFHFTDDLLKHPFFQGNQYYHYYLTLDKLESEVTREEGLKELTEREEYKSLEGAEKVINLTVNGLEVGRVIEINNEGLLLYQTRENNVFTIKLWNYEMPKRYPHNINYIHYPSINKDRTGYVFSNYVERKFFVLNRRFNSIKVIDMDGINISMGANFHWVNNNELFYYENDSGWLLNIETGEEIPFSKSNTDIPEPEISNDEERKLYRIEGDKYTHVINKRIEDIPIWYWGIRKDFYQIWDESKDELIYEMQLPFKFIGSCNKYIYGFEELDRIQVLVAIDKVTNEKHYFPIYQSFHGYNSVRYLE